MKGAIYPSRCPICGGFAAVIDDGDYPVIRVECAQRYCVRLAVDAVGASRDDVVRMWSRIGESTDD